MKAFDFAFADSHFDTNKLSPADTAPERDFTPESILVLLVAVALVAGYILTQIIDRSALGKPRRQGRSEGVSIEYALRRDQSAEGNSPPVVKAAAEDDPNEDQ